MTANEIDNTCPITIGTCQYCGQVQEVGPHASRTLADEAAAEVCSCPQAAAARHLRERIEDAKDRVNRLFGESAEDFGFRQVTNGAVMELLEAVAESAARGEVYAAVLNVSGGGRAKFAVNSKGELKISRSVTRSRDI